MGNNNEQPGTQSMIKWAKERALEYAKKGENAHALASLFSDLQKDPNRSPENIITLVNLALNQRLEDAPKEQLIKFIEGVG